MSVQFLVVLVISVVTVGILVTCYAMLLFFMFNKYAFILLVKPVPSLIIQVLLLPRLHVSSKICGASLFRGGAWSSFLSWSYSIVQRDGTGTFKAIQDILGDGLMDIPGSNVPEELDLAL